MTVARTTVHLTGMATVGIPVKDQDRAADFYVGTLGLQRQLDVPLNEFAHWIVVATPVSTSTTIALQPESDHREGGGETGIRLTAHNADATNAGLKANGVDVDEVLRWLGVPARFAFRDHNGNGLKVVQEPGGAEAR